eukprot:SAG22_NODE_1835_length_3468_cov_3.304541_1_plen_340_part_10
MWSELLDKALQHVHPDIVFSASGLAVVNDFVTDVLRRLVQSAMKTPAAVGEHLVMPIAGEVPVLLACTLAPQDPSRLICKRLDPATGSDSEVPPRKASAGVLTVQTIESTVLSVLVGELGKHAISEGTKAVALLSSASEASPPGGPAAAAAAAAAAVVSPLSVAEVAAVAAISSELSNGIATLTAEAAVFLAAVVEYLAGELLELSGNAAKDLNEVGIGPRHLCLAISGDEELDRLMANVIVRDGGVVPHIHKSICCISIREEREATCHHIHGGGEITTACEGLDLDRDIVKQAAAFSVESDITFVYPEGSLMIDSWGQRFGDMLEQAPDGLLVDPSDGR